MVDACTNASFNGYMNTLSESISTVLSYGLTMNANKEKIILIFYIGSGILGIPGFL